MGTPECLGGLELLQQNSKEVTDQIFPSSQKQIKSSKKLTDLIVKMFLHSATQNLQRFDLGGRVLVYNITVKPLS